MALLHAIEAVLGWVVVALEVLAAATILASAVWSLVTLARLRGVIAARRHLSDGLLLALDFTIGADVLKVALDPDWRNVAVVGGIVVVRVVLAAALIWELRQERRAEPAQG